MDTYYYLGDVMIKLDHSHIRSLDTFVPQDTLEKLNNEIERQWNELIEKDILKVKCQQHYPKNAGTGHTIDAVTKRPVDHVWYQNKCGDCGETIYPHSWVTVDK